MPRVFAMTEGIIDSQRLAEAAALLRRGGLVAFPTETVYGLGADATNAQAMERLGRVKGRPQGKYYSLHVGSVEQFSQLVEEVPALARLLIERWWPGPLTLVLPSPDGATVGYRVPDHPLAQAFLSACGVPVAAPSANRSGASPPRNAAAVIEAFGDAIEGVIDGGPTRLGRESTVVEVRGSRLMIHREGAIARAAIDATTPHGH